ncbi:MAG: DUF2207 domain-containing protein [Bacteroidales bacterium]
MKRICVLLFLVLGLLSAKAQERILSYDIDAEIEMNGTLLVREQISVVAEGNAIKRGIYRTFPTKYKDRLGNRFKVDFEVTEVLKNGAPEPWFTEEKSNGVIVYIGDSDIELAPGTYNYTLSFKTTRQIGFFDDYDELYYNAIGGDWAFTIESATVTLKLPQGANVVQKAAYSGYAGSTGCDCEFSESGNVFSLTTTRPLQPQEQLTIAVAWPKGFVTCPPAIARAANFLKDNLHILFALAGIAGAIMLYFRKWKSAGKDPAKGTIIPLFDPPEGFSPAATGYLSNMGMKEEVVTAALVNMAVSGYLKIIRTKKKYSLELVPGADAVLTPEEKALASALFAGNQEIVLDNENHMLFQKARSEAENILKEKMIPEYFNLNVKHLLPGVLFSVALVLLTFVISPSPAIPVILIILLVGLGILFAWLIKAPTPRGRLMMDEAEGFKMYLSVAEKERLDLMHEPELTVERFENLLPYAIALGVENQWGQKFENALKQSMQGTKTYSPAWYIGTGFGAAAFSPSNFTSTMGKSFSSAISSASTPPGSSSGSGGGGSSGGGGGGGGGGGW